MELLTRILMAWTVLAVVVAFALSRFWTQAAPPAIAAEEELTEAVLFLKYVDQEMSDEVVNPV